MILGAGVEDEVLRQAAGAVVVVAELLVEIVDDGRVSPPRDRDEEDVERARPPQPPRQRRSRSTRVERAPGAEGAPSGRGSTRRRGSSRASARARSRSDPPSRRASSVAGRRRRIRQPRTRARARRRHGCETPSGGRATHRVPTRTSATARRISFQAWSAVNAPPRTPAPYSAAMTALCAAKPTTHVYSATTGLRQTTIARGTSNSP